MATYCVYHHIHVRTPHEYIPKLFITDVPPGKEVSRDLVDEYYTPSEFGIAWANHGISRLDSPELRRAYRQRHQNDIPCVSYQHLVSLQKEEL